MPKRQRTADGLEKMFATNYLAPVLLTNLLLPALTAAAPSRVINVASGAQAMGGIDFADLQGEKRYRGMRAYAQSKLALITWTYELARRLSGTGVAVNAFEPGIVATKLPGRISPFVALIRPFMTTPEQGARTSVLLASAPHAASYSGNYFSSKGTPIRSRQESYDRAVAQRLWEETTSLVGVPTELAAVPSR
jgi:NAD(P)-dependent dehydrogenase (short-subunit alcohol dehydrogenase family)